MNDRGVPLTQRQFPGRGQFDWTGLPFSGSLRGWLVTVVLQASITLANSTNTEPLVLQTIPILLGHNSSKPRQHRPRRDMKLYATLILFAVVVASPCTVVCRESRTVPPGCDPVALRPCTPVIWGQAPSAACCAKLREQKPCLCKYLSKYINSPEAMKVVAACGLKGLRC
jgi:hypothetical protein